MQTIREKLESYGLSVDKTYIYKGKQYVVTDLGTFKEPTTRDWITTVQYENNQGESFNREIEDFKSKFKVFKVEPNIEDIECENLDKSESAVPEAKPFEPEKVAIEFINKVESIIYGELDKEGNRLPGGMIHEGLDEQDFQEQFKALTFYFPLLLAKNHAKDFNTLRFLQDQMDYLFNISLDAVASQVYKQLTEQHKVDEQ